MAASATFALKAGVWFRRGRLCMVSPDSQATACPLSGRNSTYRPVQISGTGSDSEIILSSTFLPQHHGLQMPAQFVMQINDRRWCQCDNCAKSKIVAKFL